MYKVKINYAEVENWDCENGTSLESTRWIKDIKTSETIENLSRKDVLNAVTKMLYHNGSVTTDDLFDGNENFFLFSRLENGEGEELDEDTNGYYVTYSVDVEQCNNIRAIDIR